MKRYRVKLSAEERQKLKALVPLGRAAAYKHTHGRVPRFSRGQALLLNDEAYGEVFATLVNVSLNTLRLACVWKDGFLPECPCRCEPRPVPSARNRLSPGSSDTQPDFAIVLTLLLEALIAYRKGSA